MSKEKTFHKFRFERDLKYMALCATLAQLTMNTLRTFTVSLCARMLASEVEFNCLLFSAPHSLLHHCPLLL